MYVKVTLSQNPWGPVTYNLMSCAATKSWHMFSFGGLGTTPCGAMIRGGSGCILMSKGVLFEDLLHTYMHTDIRMSF